MKRRSSTIDLMQIQPTARTGPNQSEAVRTGPNRSGPNHTEPSRSGPNPTFHAVKIEIVEIICSIENLGQSNHFKLKKTSEKMKVRNSLSPVLLSSTTFKLHSLHLHSYVGRG